MQYPNSHRYFFFLNATKLKKMSKSFSIMIFHSIFYAVIEETETSRRVLLNPEIKTYICNKQLLGKNLF